MKVNITCNKDGIHYLEVQASENEAEDLAEKILRDCLPGVYLPADVAPEMPSGRPVSDELLRDLVRAAFEADKIMIIKVVRALTNWNLSESKDFVDRNWAYQKPSVSIK